MPYGEKYTPSHCFFCNFVDWEGNRFVISNSLYWVCNIESLLCFKSRNRLSQTIPTRVCTASQKKTDFHANFINHPTKGMENLQKTVYSLTVAVKRTHKNSYHLTLKRMC